MEENFLSIQICAMVPAIVQVMVYHVKYIAGLIQMDSGVPIDAYNF